MAYNEILADRVRRILLRIPNVGEKQMMGGLVFMVNDKMCVCVVRDDLMARIDPDDYEMALSQEGCREMDFTKRPMKGFVFVGPEGTSGDESIEYWVNLALKFNVKAKSSKKRKK
jgi:TfoX/Sxy family transcriptional regulator of competence genes